MQQNKSVLCYQFTCQCGEEIKAPFDRFHEKGYIRWVSSTCGLQYTKEGLEDFVEKGLYYVYGDIKQLIDDAVKCKCDLTKIGIKTFRCHKKVCTVLKQKIELTSNHAIKWQNVTIYEISSPDQLAKLFISKEGARSHEGPASADISDLLKLIDRCLPIRVKVQNPDTISKVIASRNKLMHSNTMAVTKEEFDEHMENCINLLENMPRGDARCYAAIEQIKKMRLKEEPTDAIKVVEQRALLNLHKANSAILEKLKDKCDKATGEKLMKLKRQLFEKTQHERERKAIFTVFDIDTSEADQRTTLANTLFDNIEQRQEIARIDMSKNIDKLTRTLRDKEDEIERMSRYVHFTLEDLARLLHMPIGWLKRMLGID